MKKLLLSAVLLGLSSTAAYALSGGLYVGGQLGYGDAGYDNHQAFIPTDAMGSGATDISHRPGVSVDSTGIAGRIYTGLQFNQSLAAEVGYTLFSNSNAKTNDGLKADISEQAVDASVKLIYPLSNAFSVYAKGGAAIVHENQDFTDRAGGITKISSSTDPIRPLFGAGAAYNITQNLALEGSWTRIQGNNNIQNLDLYGAGLTYYFG